MNRTALVTGATSGIGAAFAAALAQRGFNLIVTGRRKAKLEAVSERLAREHKVSVRTVVAELSDPLELRRVIDAVEDTEAESPIAVLVNNAGFGMSHLFEEISADEAVRMIDVHVQAVVRITRAVLPHMIRRKDGAVINVSSVAGFFPLPRSSMYSATKGFLNIFSQALQIEVAAHNIRVQALCPGMTRTDFHSRQETDPEEEAARRFMPWMSAEQVVKLSLRRLGSSRVVYVPGLYYKGIVFLSRLIPWPLYARLVRFRVSHKKPPSN